MRLGRHFATGGLYRPLAGSWMPLSTRFVPFGRTEHTAVWSGEQVIVWGGWRGASAHITASGGAYRPAEALFADGFEGGGTESWTAP